jgi:hypothetical protein
MVHPTSAYGTKPQPQHSSIKSSAQQVSIKSTRPADAVHHVYKLKTQPELVWYLHTSAGFPTKPTWLKAIKNKQFSSWLGLTTDEVRHHFPDSDKTNKGHGQRTPSRLRVTKQTQAAVQPEEQDDDKNMIATKQKTVFFKVYNLAKEALRKIWTDQTGHLPKQSSRGNQYIMVLTKSDSSAILVEPMKNRSSDEMLQAYQALIDCFNATGIFPLEHILHNECSALFNQQIQLNKMTYQLVPLHNHRRNQATKAIQIFKDHFVSILYGMDPSFPLHLWG